MRRYDGEMVTLHGSPVALQGSLISVGERLPKLTLVDAQLNEVRPDGPLLINVFPSVDTSVCARQTRSFNERADGLGVKVWTISLDLPFALGRFCAAEGIQAVTVLSDFRYRSLAAAGLQLADGPMAGLYARAVMIVDAKLQLRYFELVPEITQEPDYEQAVAAVASLR